MIISETVSNKKYEIYLEQQHLEDRFAIVTGIYFSCCQHLERALLSLCREEIT
jgi:hypothetical protein